MLFVDVGAPTMPASAGLSSVHRQMRTGRGFCFSRKAELRAYSPSPAASRASAL